MTRVRVVRACLVVNLACFVVLAVVTVVGLVTGAGLSPLLTGCAALSVGGAVLLLARGGGGR